MGAVIPSNTYLHSAAYRTGERRLRFSDVDDYQTAAGRLKVPLCPELGLGHFCVTENVYELLQESISDSIRLSGMAAASIDHVVFCSSHFAHPFPVRNRGIASALVNSGIAPRSMRGVCGLGCADVLCGIEIAINALALRAATNVLVMGLEAFSDSKLSARLLDYAIISDAVVTFIVSQLPGESASYQIIASESVSILSNVGTGMNISHAKAYGRTATAALESAHLGRGMVTKVFGGNTFLLVKKAREMSAGFAESQMYFRNVERLGHCLACDPIINMIDYGGSGDPCHYILFAEAEGYGSAVLLSGCARYA